jgi:hypothetical protein
MVAFRARRSPGKCTNSIRLWPSEVCSIDVGPHAFEPRDAVHPQILDQPLAERHAAARS